MGAHCRVDCVSSGCTLPLHVHLSVRASRRMVGIVVCKLMCGLPAGSVAYCIPAVTPYSIVHEQQLAGQHGLYWHRACTGRRTSIVYASCVHRAAQHDSLCTMVNMTPPPAGTTSKHRAYGAHGTRYSAIPVGAQARIPRCTNGRWPTRNSTAGAVAAAGSSSAYHPTTLRCCAAMTRLEVSSPRSQHLLFSPVLARALTRYCEC